MLMQLFSRRKKENKQIKPPTNTSHLAHLTLEPANIVFSIFVPFPIPTTAKTEGEMPLQKQLCSSLTQHRSLLNIMLVRNTAFHALLEYTVNDYEKVSLKFKQHKTSERKKI